MWFRWRDWSPGSSCSSKPSPGVSEPPAPPSLGAAPPAGSAPRRLRPPGPAHSGSDCGRTRQVGDWPQAFIEQILGKGGSRPWGVPFLPLLPRRASRAPGAAPFSC